MTLAEKEWRAYWDATQASDVEVRNCLSNVDETRVSEPLEATGTWVADFEEEAMCP